MSNALALAAVTATLRDLIETGIETDPGVSGISVTTRPLDRARDTAFTNQVNLFLYHTSENAAWQNMDIPRRRSPGSPGRPPLALNLYYLVTAYHGADEEEVESNTRMEGSNRLLGLAMSTLRDYAVLDAEAINGHLPALDQVDFPFTQVERVRVTLHPMSIDELSKLWSGFQTEYRLSVAYEVSVVLIESTRPSRSPLPVLRRGSGDEGVFVVPNPAPTLFNVEPPNRQAAAQFGDLLPVNGDNLVGEGLTLSFEHHQLANPLSLAPEAGRTNNQLQVQLPDPAVDATVRSTWPAGIYVLYAVVDRAPLPAFSSNGLPFGLAPQLTSRTPATAPAGVVNLSVTCTPQIRDGQRVRLLVGQQEIEADSIATPANPTAETTLTFTIAAAAAGVYTLRLRVDGVDSVPVDFSVDPTLFDPNQQLTIT